MPSNNPPMKREPISMQQMGRRLAARKAELLARGIIIKVPRNPGNNRTAPKRALLAAIEATGAKW